MAVKAKRYISKTGVKYTFLVDVKGKIKSIQFKGNEKDCIITDPATQKAVENHEHFKEGRIGVAPGTTAGGFDEEVNGMAGLEKTGEKLAVDRSNSKTKAEQEAEDEKKNKSGSDEDIDGLGDEGKKDEANIYKDVTSPLDAREILLGEPYNVHPSAVQKNPEAILKKATELGVSFPNVKFDAQ